MSVSIKTVRKKVVKKDGQSQILLRVIIDRQIKHYNTEQCVEPKYWDDNKNVVRNTYPLQIKLQNLINTFEYKAKQVIYDLQNDNVSITFENFESLFLGIQVYSKDFFVLAKDYVEKNKHLYASATYKLFGYELNKLALYKPIVYVQDINYNFYKGYEQHLYNIGNATNTVAKSIKKIRALENALFKAGLLKKTNSDSFKIKQVASNRAYLTLDELKILDEQYTKRLKDLCSKYWGDFRRHFKVSDSAPPILIA